jgi:hypothetical protein
MEIVKMIVEYAGLFLFSVVLHEIMHIKSQGLFASGCISINGWRFTCGVNDIKNMGIHLIAGGLYTGVIYILASFLFSEFTKYSLIAIGTQQTIYGIFEWKYWRDMNFRTFTILKDSIFIGGTTIFSVIYFYYNL